MNLEQMAGDLEARWEREDVACRPHVADEVCGNTLEAAVADPATLLKTYPRSTFAAAQRAAEDDIRLKYDVDREFEGRALETDTELLADQIARAIGEAETLPSECDMQRQTSSECMLLARVLEEQQRARLEQHFPKMTVGALAAAYAGWTDAGDRTAVRLVEAAVTSGRLEALGLRLDQERDAIEIPRLKQAVSARRQQRVGPALPALQARVKGLRTMQRQQTALFLREGRGIARRPRTDAA